MGTDPHSSGNKMDKTDNMRFIEISNYLDPILDMFARDSEKKLLGHDTHDNGIFIAESPKVVERALDAGYEPISLLMEKRHIEGVGKDIIERCYNVPVYFADFDVLTKITGYKLTRGMLCAMKRKPNKPIDEICTSAEKIVVLEEVQNPTNVGAIIRNAAALGIDAVLLSPGCSNPLYRRAIRVSMGTVFSIPWTYIGKSIDEWHSCGMDIIKSFGYYTVAMALGKGTDPIKTVTNKKKGKIAIIMGTEGNGLTQSVLSKCDSKVHIPMLRGVDSLNVAAASAIAFYEL